MLSESCSQGLLPMPTKTGVSLGMRLLAAVSLAESHPVSEEVVVVGCSRDVEDVRAVLPDISVEQLIKYLCT